RRRFVTGRFNPQNNGIFFCQIKRRLIHNLFKVKGIIPLWGAGTTPRIVRTLISKSVLLRFTAFGGLWRSP
ncbi:MAG: hypothetical protein J6A87_01630, partial [Clostridia bacterium]|nr:hypothetical protein [Clostridia bacterium]